MDSTAAPDPTAEQLGRPGRRALWAAAAVTLALYVVPGGDIVARPLVLLSTLFHEFGHGVAAAAVGGEVVAVRVAADGSGVTESSRPPGRLRAALVAAGGLLGPAIAAAVLLRVGSRRRWARPAALVLGAAVLLSVLFAVRGALGIALCLVLGAGLLGVGLRARGSLPQVALLFLGVQLALSVFSRGDYLFTATADTAIGPVPSDSAQIATALAGPFWLWGALCGAVSLAVLVAGLRAALRAD